LLRLGHGHEELDAASWGKSGRINSFLELRLELLAQVESMAVCLSQSPAHASTCETASYFYSTYIEPVWKRYFSGIESMSEKDIKETFPFKVYLDKIKPGVFENCKNLDETRQVVEDFNHLLLDTFDEIEQVRPFELLRSNKERSNYLLVKEARIVAMTSTHASLKRRELVRLGFQYGTVIMEEAGQMLEVETFIPLLLQNHDTDLHSTPLSRVVLIGDHHQLPPIVQSQALVKHASFDQSLFARLIKLGVPTIDLDHQGRSRPSIADLYRWKYNNLQDLPRVLDTKQGEFSKANAGFEFDFQAINVDEFRGIGESCPRPHFIQNLGEAEYVVATYMYMRLLGYVSFGLKY
jgi:intron-binding protein aquarius